MTAICVSIGSYFTGFTAKQLFCYYGLSYVRERLEEVISRVAIRQFGSFAGNFLGRQLGMLFSVPVTIFTGEILHTFVQETVKTIIYIATSFLGEQQPARSYLKDISIKIVRFVSSIFAKSFFCNFSMPIVKAGIELAAREVLKLSIYPFSHAIFSTAIALMLVSPVTFFLGDIVSIITSEAVGFLFEKAWDYFANSLSS